MFAALGVTFGRVWRVDTSSSTEWPGMAAVGAVGGD